MSKESMQQLDESAAKLKIPESSSPGERVGTAIGSSIAELYAKVLDLFLAPLPVQVQQHFLKANKELIMALQSLIASRSSPDGEAEKKEFRKLEIE